MNNYELVNPTLSGKFNSVSKAINSDDAMKELWLRLSKNFVGNIPNILVTLKQEGNDELFHYRIKEKVGNSDNITIKKIDIKLDNERKHAFLDQLKYIKDEEKKQKGGNKKNRKRYDDDDDDDDDSSDSDSEDQVEKYLKLQKKSLINKYWYTPYIYTGVGPVTVYNPVFRYPLYPYNQIWVF